MCLLYYLRSVLNILRKLEKMNEFMSNYFDEFEYNDLLNEIKYVYQSDSRPWIIGYSGGKDSTTVVELVYEMLYSLPARERTKNVCSLY